MSALAVFDDGTGPALFAGGYFPGAGGYLAYGIAKWNGASWSSLLSFEDGGLYFGIPELVYALTVYDDGSGAALYVGGRFHGAGNTAANSIVKWDGIGWTPLGAGVEGDYAEVRALTVFDDGNGPALCAAGKFSLAGGAPAVNIGKWDGTSWSPLGLGLGNVYDKVEALAVYNDGGGRALYAAGPFAAPVGTYNLASWNGDTWTLLAYAEPIVWVPDVDAFAVLKDDDGSEVLYAGGFALAGESDYSGAGVAKWDGQDWSVIADSPGWVNALAEFDDGAGRALCTGGYYNTLSDNFSRWRCSCPHCDANGDDDVDLDDYLVVSNCIGGPSAPVSSECLDARLDAGPFIDLWDFAVLQNNFTGPAGN